MVWLVLKVTLGLKALTQVSNHIMSIVVYGIAAVIGPPGEQGISGQTGLSGLKGPNGTIGVMGPNGTEGDFGDVGKNGVI